MNEEQQLSDNLVEGSQDLIPTTSITAASNSCPPATQDIAINLENRKKAIDTAMYGPLNPGEPNEEYWSALAGEWNVDTETAKQQRCGNCAVFIQTPEMMSCIENGLTENSDEFDSINEAGQLGYCEIFDFKCASARTCRAWVAGGPVTAAGSAKTAAPKKDQIKGSDKNKKGSASGSKKVVFSKTTENTLAQKVKEHNEKAPKGRKATIGMLKAVYRRGAGAFSTSHRPGMNRNQWAMGRVNAFLKLLKSGKPTNSSYTTDNDLLPSGHPKSSRSVKASGLDTDYEEELLVTLGDRESYQYPEEAIIAMAEISGYGYEAEGAIRASWLRAVRAGGDPFVRASMLAIHGKFSIDADLLPSSEKGSE